MGFTITFVKKNCPECEFEGAKRDVWEHIQTNHAALAFEIRKKAKKESLRLMLSKRPDLIAQREERAVTGGHIKITFQENVAFKIKKGGIVTCPFCQNELTTFGQGFGEFYAIGPEELEYKLGFDHNGCQRSLLIYVDEKNEEEPKEN